MASRPYLQWNSDRRFGIELELNSFDGKNRPEQGQRPAGIDYVAMVVARRECEIEIREWEHTHGNEVWVLKPDSSCGMELCTPVYKGWTGLKKCCEVVHAIQEDPKIKTDSRCSVHVHIEIGDLTPEEMGNVVAWWIKCEPVFMDSVPNHRKRNRYCQFMGMTSLFQHDTNIGGIDLVRKVGNVKYYSFNAMQFIKNGRKTFEFRIIEGDGCKDPLLIKNWVRLLIHFVEMAKKKPPVPFEEGNPWSSFLWLDPIDVFKFLGFLGDYELSPGLKQTRNWFLGRLQKFMPQDVNDGPRSVAYKELNEIIGNLAAEGIIIAPEVCLAPSDIKDALFNEELKS